MNDGGSRFVSIEGTRERRGKSVAGRWTRLLNEVARARCVKVRRWF